MKKMSKGKAVLALSIFLLITMLRSKDWSTFFQRMYNSEKFDLKDDILDDVIKAYKENKYIEKGNVAAACGYYCMALYKGCLSVTGEYHYDDNVEHYQYINDNDYNCLLGTGVCKDENILISKLLNASGFDTVPIINYPEEGSHVYILVYDHSINKKYIYDYTNNCFWKINDFDSIINTTGKFNSTSKADLVLTYLAYIDFDIDDIIKINSFENNKDFEKIIYDYNVGKIAFSKNDMEYINELTYDKKEKIKKIENL